MTQLPHCPLVLDRKEFEGTSAWPFDSVSTYVEVMRSVGYRWNELPPEIHEIDALLFYIGVAQRAGHANFVHMAFNRDDGTPDIYLSAAERAAQRFDLPETAATIVAFRKLLAQAAQGAEPTEDLILDPGALADLDQRMAQADRADEPTYRAEITKLENGRVLPGLRSWADENHPSYPKPLVELRLFAAVIDYDHVDVVETRSELSTRLLQCAVQDETILARHRRTCFSQETAPELMDVATHLKADEMAGGESSDMFGGLPLSGVNLGKSRYFRPARAAQNGHAVFVAQPRLFGAYLFHGTWQPAPRAPMQLEYATFGPPPKSKVLDLLYQLICPKWRKLRAQTRRARKGPSLRLDKKIARLDTRQARQVRLLWQDLHISAAIACYTAKFGRSGLHLIKFGKVDLNPKAPSIELQFGTERAPTLKLTVDQKDAVWRDDQGRVLEQFDQSVLSELVTSVARGSD